jgi:N-acetylglucosamine malate deacetylase 1
VKLFTLSLVIIAVHLATHDCRFATAGELAGPDKKLKIVVFGGHPDDPESGAGGLIATLTRQGHEVICAYGTCFRGDRNFFGRPEADVRKEEAGAACKVLGATPKFFPYAHEKLAADKTTLKEVDSWLAEVKPDIVVTHWPLDTHPNHHVVSSLVWQCYQHRGGWNLYFFEVMTDQQTIGFAPDLFLDIAPVRDLKKRSLDAHKSQGPDNIWRSHERMHRRRGAECGVESAEAYKLLEAKKDCPLLPVPFREKVAGGHLRGANLAPSVNGLGASLRHGACWKWRIPTNCFYQVYERIGSVQSVLCPVSLAFWFARSFPTRCHQ